MQRTNGFCSSRRDVRKISKILITPLPHEQNSLVEPEESWTQMRERSIKRIKREKYRKTTRLAPRFPPYSFLASFPPRVLSFPSNSSARRQWLFFPTMFEGRDTGRCQMGVAARQNGELVHVTTRDRESLLHRLNLARGFFLNARKVD